jgi:hypothetical protein
MSTFSNISLLLTISVIIDRSLSLTVLYTRVSVAREESRMFEQQTFVYGKVLSQSVFVPKRSSDPRKVMVN